MTYRFSLLTLTYYISHISHEQVGRDLHLKKDHPLGIIKEKIETVGH